MVANEASGTVPPGADTKAEVPDALLDLHGEREALERRLVHILQRRQFGTDAGDIARTDHEEREALLDLDRLLTLIRAAEYQCQPGARRW